MAIRPLVFFPDPRLRLPAVPVTAFDDTLRRLAEDLLHTVRAAPGIGITAPHVGELVRLVVLNLGSGDPVRMLANPRVLAVSGDLVSHTEGSISMPGIAEEVERPAQVRVAYQDLDGAAQEITADGLLGVCLQHEIDQLDGIFWLQRLSRLKRDRAVKRFAKLQVR
ncbi:peptide deformylase [Aquabacter sp. L1I39]|uniref:peptide deformylase n=1 Tax=Aquabacter sp. L1I39 TaxID=2820278 RepID=UPI001ADBE948|nr:peptide deformylase [Aquabacter sp. L1I39]QTL03836.1 peptide deformylase [Aquabacter sp. L1I39]